MLVILASLCFRDICRGFDVTVMTSALLSYSLTTRKKRLLLVESKTREKGKIEKRFESA